MKINLRWIKDGNVRAKIMKFSGENIGGGDFPGGAVFKNPPANAGDTDLIPGPGRSHMLWSN